MLPFGLALWLMMNETITEQLYFANHPKLQKRQLIKTTNGPVISQRQNGEEVREVEEIHLILSRNKNIVLIYAIKTLALSYRIRGEPIYIARLGSVVFLRIFNLFSLFERSNLFAPIQLCRPQSREQLTFVCLIFSHRHIFLSV